VKDAAHEIATVTSDRLPRAPANGEGEITSILRLAVEKQVPVETLERLVALQERMSDRAAAAEFAQALADFQAECPPIRKTETAEIVGRDQGRKFTYRFAPLDEIARTIRPLLHRRGLSYSWDQKIDKGLLECTCKLLHVNGHFQTSTFTVPTESSSGAMSPAQKNGSALTFARRYSLTAVLGLTSTEDDSDAAPPRSTDPITPDQIADLENRMEEVGADPARFMTYLCSLTGRKILHLDDLYADEHGKAAAALEAKRRKQ
jgi:hypothetical protein